MGQKKWVKVSLSFLKEMDKHIQLCYVMCDIIYFILESLATIISYYCWINMKLKDNEKIY